MVRSSRTRKNARRPKHLAAWLFLITLLVLLASVLGRVHFLVLEYSKNMIQYVTTKEINTAISDKILTNPDDFQNLVKLERDSENHVTALTTNTVGINQAKEELQKSVYEGIRNLTNQELKIPAGNILPFDFLSGRGPEIPVHMVGLGYIEAKMASAFTQAGINQTRHNLIVEITAEFTIITPFGKKEIQVKNDYHLTDTVVVGIVPESYVYIDKMHSSILGKINDNP